MDAGTVPHTMTLAQHFDQRSGRILAKGSECQPTAERLSEDPARRDPAHTTRIAWRTTRTDSWLALSGRGSLAFCPER